jgi:hypothetical protein
MPVDILSKMRGVEPFPKLWKRRTTIELPDGLRCDLLGLSDLVRAKKTQRDKDWPMIRRLVEAHYFQNRERAKPAQVGFWLRELRTPALLIEVAQSNNAAARKAVSKRPLISPAIAGNAPELERALRDEELTERQRDKNYWSPLRKELEKLRHSVSRGSR